MKTLPILLALLASAGPASAGGGHPHGPDGSHPAPAASVEDEFPSGSVTHFTTASELFVEFPFLVRGRNSRFAAHLTTLPDFRAVAAGKVAVTLSGDGKPEERFEVDGPGSPGIFRPVVHPAHAGRRRVKLSLDMGAGPDVHDLGVFRVFDDERSARAAAPEEVDDANAVPFLKEQQWRVDFRMEPATRRKLRPALHAYGSLVPRSGGESTVVAPASGRLNSPTDGFPVPGSRVARRQVLARLAPQLDGGGADLPSLELAVTTLDLRLRFLAEEKARLAPLVASGAIPERRLAVLANEERSFVAERDAARRRLELFRTLQGGAGRTAPSASVSLAAPLSGTVVFADAVDGAFVAEAAPLFRIVDTDQLWLEALVPEADAGRIVRVDSASFTVEGSERSYEVGRGSAGRLISLGVAVDPRTRCVPVIFEVPNQDGELRSGLSAKVRLFSGEPEEVLAIPVGAIVEDGGVDVAFVQIHGESYSRRNVRLGRREAGYVEVLEGIAEGEWVVTRGAWLVRLAGSSGSVPAHGHAH